MYYFLSFKLYQNTKKNYKYSWSLQSCYYCLFPKVIISLNWYLSLPVHGSVIFWTTICIKKWRGFKNFFLYSSRDIIYIYVHIFVYISKMYVDVYIYFHRKWYRCYTLACALFLQILCLRYFSMTSQDTCFIRNFPELYYFIIFYLYENIKIYFKFPVLWNYFQCAIWNNASVNNCAFFT